MTVKTDNYQIGLDSVTDSKNYLIDTDITGALRIRRNSDGSGATVLNIEFDNKITAPGQPASAFSCVRLNTATGYGSTNTKVLRYSTQVINQGTDITYADSATLGMSCTINTSGVYAVSMSTAFTLAAGSAISLNAISGFGALATLAQSISGAANWNVCNSWTGYLAAGSVIRAITDGTALSGTAQNFTITKVSL